MIVDVRTAAARTRTAPVHCHHAQTRLGQAVGDQLPAGVETLLVDVVADGFTLYCCGPKAAPNALVASYEWHDYVDLLTIRDFDRITTARVPAPGRKVDLFAPRFVVWAYEGPPRQALQALHNLVHPKHPDAPAVEYSAPAGLHVPRTQQRPMTIQLPAPHRAGMRAARLATAMTNHGGHGVHSAAPSWCHDHSML